MLKKSCLSVLIIIYVFCCTGCSVNPVTGEKELMFISEKQEIELGKKIDQGLRMQYGLYDNPAMTAYVRNVGQSIAPYTHRNNLKYHFAILDTPVQNAFAAPGGYIYITRGLLAMINSEAELAVVIGHELGHVNARHSARAMSRQLLFNLGLAVGSAVSKDVRRWAPLAALTGNLLFLKFSRSDEYQADSLGISYARQAGYFPGSMVTFFHSLQKLTVEKGGGHKLPNFLSTHPLTKRRIAEVQAMLKSGDSSLKVRRNAYLSRINGLVYGINPRQGYIENSTFFHPDMGFSFRVPRGWKVQNTPRQVIMADASGKAAIVFNAQSSSQSLQDYASTKLNASLSNSRIISSRSGRTHSLPLHYIEFMTASQQNQQNSQPVKGRLYCIRKGSLVYSFFGISSAGDFVNYSAQLRHPPLSFRTLRNSRHLKRRPMRVRIHRVPRAQTLKQYLLSRKYPGKLWQDIEILNLMQPDFRLKKNQNIKLIYY